MTELENLQSLAIEQIRKTTDTDLLDLILKMLVIEGQELPGAA